MNHPHIGAIYGLEELGDSANPGGRALVMEFVEGESLSGLLKREGQLQPEVALKTL